MPSASPVTGWKSGGNRTSRSASRRATADGAEAVAQSLRHRPDVVLMDIRMPGMDGLEATRRILAIAASPQPSRWQSFSTYGQFARIDAEVITQGGNAVLPDPNSTAGHYVLLWAGQSISSIRAHVTNYPSVGQSFAVCIAYAAALLTAASFLITRRDA